MKLAIIFPGYLDSPNYRHMKIFSERFKKLGYETVVLDPCHLWETNEIKNYTVTNYLKDIRATLDLYKDKNPEETVLVGHSLGGAVSIMAGSMYSEVTKIVALCPPASTKALGLRWENKPSKLSRRDLPEDPTKFREFDVPYSFVEEANTYSALETVKKINKPLMILIALADTSVSAAETETLVTNANHPHVVRMENMGHNFRNSETECNLVMDEIQKFVTSNAK
jgi:pimeloyl-ACP methyl ester carboxylesterase